MNLILKPVIDVIPSSSFVMSIGIVMILSTLLRRRLHTADPDNRIE